MPIEFVMQMLIQWHIRLHIQKMVWDITQSSYIIFVFIYVFVVWHKQWTKNYLYVDLLENWLLFEKMII